MTKEERKEYAKKYYQKNKEKILERTSKYHERNRKYRDENDYNKRYYKENKDAIKAKSKEYYEEHREEILEKTSEYYKDNRNKKNEYMKKYLRERKEEDLLFNLITSIRSLIYSSIKNKGYSKDSKTQEILGCSYNELKEYLESKFLEGMTWENKGEWHIDHIKPTSLAKTEEEVYELNRYTNLQPLWAIDNIKKGNKYN